IVDHQHRYPGYTTIDRAHDIANRAHFVESRHDHQQRIGTLGADHSAATLRALMAWARMRWRKTAGVMRARRRISRLPRHKRGKCANRVAWARKTYHTIFGPACPSARNRAALPRPPSRYQACHAYRATVATGAGSIMLAGKFF